MSFIETIPYDQAQDELKAIYDELIATRGKLAAVHQIQSLNPVTIKQHMDLYMSIMFKQSPLRRYQREMMAVVVSNSNGCQYCQVHHGEALNHFWKNGAKVEQLKLDFNQLDLNAVDLSLCRYAQQLTLSPGKAHDGPFVQPLKDLGLSDRAILDASLVISYFNFVNRLVMGLGVGLEEDPGNYSYD